MARAVYEFYCNDCDGWILLTLSEALRGRYMVECPNCHHRHPRTLNDAGVDLKADTTEVKTNGGKRSMWINRDTSASAEDVLQPMPSTYSKKSRIDKIEEPTVPFFVRKGELWAEHAGQVNQMDFTPPPKA